MKKILLIMLTVSFVSVRSVQAEDAFKDFFNSCTYGVVTGMLIGGASLALAEDPGSNISPITKGASLGLYAGAMVSIYKNWYAPRRTRIDFGYQPEIFVVPQESGMVLALKWGL